AQVLACLKGLGVPFNDSRVNPNGGAIAVGPPLGASGTRLALTPTRPLHRPPGRHALVSMCIRVGQGLSGLLWRVDRSRPQVRFASGAQGFAAILRAGTHRSAAARATDVPAKPEFHFSLSKISFCLQGPRVDFVGRVSVYTEILSISSRARSCRSFGIVSMGNVEAVCGTRHVLRTIVESSSRSVWKLWTGVPSSSCFE